MANEKRNNILIYAVIFLLLFILCRLFPYTADDWATSTAPIRWSLPKYNGRYIGHFIEQFTSHFIWLRSILACLVLFLLGRICTHGIKQGRCELFILALIIFFAMPRDIFAQAVVWCSGFTMFGISTLLSMLYLWITRNVFDENAPAYPVWQIAVAALLGLSGAFFVENLTVFNLLIGSIIFLAALIRFRRVYAVHAAYLLGAAAGAVEVFSNQAYSAAAGGTDGQYALELSGLDAIWEKALENYRLICDYLLSESILLEVLVALFLVLLLFGSKTLKTPVLKGLRIVVLAVVIAYPCYNAIKLAFPAWDMLMGATEVFEDIWSLLYIICVFVSLFLFREKGYGRLVFEFLCVWLAAAPLLVISPLTSRCLFPSYVLMAYFVTDLLISFLNGKGFADITTPLRFGLLTVLGCCFVFYLSVYAVIWHYDGERGKYVRGKAERGNQEIAVTRLPYEEYLFGSIPDVPFYKMAFKRYYGINEDVQLDVVSFTEWLSYMEQ